MSGRTHKMKERINAARKKAGEKPVKFHCCRYGWIDVHTRSCPKHPDNLKRSANTSDNQKQRS